MIDDMMIHKSYSKWLNYVELMMNEMMNEMMTIQMY